MQSAKWRLMICTAVSCFLLFAGAKAQEPTDTDRGGPFLEAGLFAGGQMNTLKWADENKADGSLWYVETGLDYIVKQPLNRLDHRIGFVASIDYGNESGDKSGFGVGFRGRYGLSRNWALLGHAAFLTTRNSEIEAANEQGSQFYFFNEGRQFRLGLFHRRGYSLSAMWRVIKYDVEFHQMGNSDSQTLKGTGEASFFGLGIMLHGKKGVYAGFGSLLCFAFMTFIGQNVE